MIELHWIDENCARCEACEEAFSVYIPPPHPGVKKLAQDYEYFSHIEWPSLAVPVFAAVRSCPHDALLVIERGGGEDGTAA